jgi:hypothetical protein
VPLALTSRRTLGHDELSHHPPAARTRELSLRAAEGHRQIFMPGEIEHLEA